MTDKELKRLSRSDLLEMLIAQSKEVQTLQAKLTAAETALHQREITIDKAGSIAEAALQLNGVFDSAQAACAQYIENIRRLSQQQEEACARMEAESAAKAKAILDEAEQTRTKLEQKTAARCAEMTQKAQAEVQAYWDTVFSQLNLLLGKHPELQSLLPAAAPQIQTGEHGHETT